ncbi:MAG: membrane dipeptidase, partial [Bacilli bacterium]
YKKLNSIFTKNGYSLYMVGGTTRDFLLGKEIVDFDFVTSATPEQMKEFLNVEDDCFKSGSITIYFEGCKVDITTLRTEGAYLDYRHPSEVNFVTDIRLDYPRRDFTINALYINEDEVVIDFINGQRDLKEKIIRMIGDPFIRLEEDPLRILRALRFASSLSFDIDEELKKAINEKRYLLQKINFSKCISELEKMKSSNYSASIQLLKEYHIDDILPIEENFSSYRYNVIDMHCDTITLLESMNKPLLRNDYHIDIFKLFKGQYMLQCFAIFHNLSNGHLFERFKDSYSYFVFEIEKNKNVIGQITNYQELMNNKSQHKLSALLTVEEGGMIEGSLANLEYLYQCGVRMMTLTWNFPNEIGYPNIFYDESGADLYTPNNKDGLTPFGISVVRKMNELGMIIDVSHLSDKGFYDVINYSKDPIVASHSNARSVQGVVRNLTDDMILKLKENGGVMGINYCPIFVSSNQEDQIEDIVDHIVYIKNLAGIDVIALGSDFDGIGTPKGMENASCILKLKEALLRRGFTLKEIKKIFQDNFLRVFKKVCRK